MYHLYVKIFFERLMKRYPGVVEYLGAIEFIDIHRVVHTCKFFLGKRTFTVKLDESWNLVITDAGNKIIYDEDPTCFGEMISFQKMDLLNVMFPKETIAKQILYALAFFCCENDPELSRAEWYSEHEKYLDRLIRSIHSLGMAMEILSAHKETRIEFPAKVIHFYNIKLSVTFTLDQKNGSTVEIQMKDINGKEYYKNMTIGNFLNEVGTGDLMQIFYDSNRSPLFEEGK